MKVQSLMLIPFVGGALSLVIREEASTTGLTLSTTASTVASQTDAPDGDVEVTLNERAVAFQYIIEVENPSVVENVASALVEADQSCKVIKKWTDKLLPGLVVEAAIDLHTISTIPGVLNVWESQKVTLPESEERPQGPVGENGDGQVETTQPRPGRSGFRRLRPRQVGNPIYSAENYSKALHRMTGVNKLHEAGILGAGVTIAVVDDGILYTHPALGGGLGPEFKVKGGHDFLPVAGDNEDEDPMVEFGSGHGTHVSGIAAGVNEWFSGVAPNASLLVYKIFGRSQPVEFDLPTVMEAWKAAYEDGADIITMSVGIDGGFTDNPLARLGDRLIENGVVVVVSAGNSGAVGPINPNDYCSGRTYLCVASVEATVRPGDPIDFAFEVNGTSTTTQIGHVGSGKFSVFFQPEGVPGSNSMEQYADIWGKPVSVVSVGDACSTVPPLEGEVAQTVLLVSQTNCDLGEKAQVLGELGAQYVLFYEDGAQGVWLPDNLFPVTDRRVGYGIIEKEAGEAILATLEAGGKVHATFSNNKDGRVLPVKHSHGGIASWFSSWGGTYDLSLKPDVAAPGGDIYSTYAESDFNPPFDNIAAGWRVFNGTSMAAPYVAGTAALYLGVHGGRAANGNGIAKTVVDAIRASGRHVPWGMDADNGEGPNRNPVPENSTAPPMHVGSGLIDAFSVVNSQTSLSFQPFALNDTKNFQGTHEIVIKNSGTESVAYQFSHDKQVGVEGRADKATMAQYTEFKVIEISPEVVLPPNKVSVAPGGSETVKVTFMPPQATDTSKLPFYNGRIELSGSNGEQFAIPYFGAAFDLKAEIGNVFVNDPAVNKVAPGQDDTDNIPMKWMFGDEQVIGASFTFQLKWGSTEARLDIFEDGWEETSWTWPPSGSKGYVGQALLGGDFLTKNLVRSPREYSLTWRGHLFQQDRLPPGKYHTRFAVLRPFGDLAVAEDWTVFDTPALTAL